MKKFNKKVWDSYWLESWKAEEAENPKEICYVCGYYNEYKRFKGDHPELECKFVNSSADLRGISGGFVVLVWGCQYLPHTTNYIDELVACKRLKRF